jgi:hypothetical protein
LTAGVVTCCGVLEKIKAEYGMPFHQPITYDDKMQLHVGPWAIRLFKLTPTGNIAKRGHTNLFLNYCPICGRKLRDDAPEATNES